MSYPYATQQQPFPQQQGVPPAPPRRPAFVVVVSVVTALSAVFSLIGAFLVYAGGKEFADDYLRQAMDDNPDAVGLPDGLTSADIKGMSGPMWNEAVSGLQDTVTVRAGFAVFFALCLLLFTVFMLRTGARWARVLITVVAVVQFILPHTLILGDEPPNSLFMTSFPAVLLGVLALILVWLPPVGRFNKGHKAAGSVRV
ncbi:hypothetical protein [Streptomyces iconiensis]|uniref:Uncharacterized protein n=1 Tax=Streptomyces iconiensis TaxID=1384038 RepID=A0ABT7A7S5_9ACTN|nr:hypothetical protein [Streptomyces iconiensis]MDJ1137385.1 hypothetical protein [Streptomyces iconiensis]